MKNCTQMISSGSRICSRGLEPHRPEVHPVRDAYLAFLGVLDGLVIEPNMVEGLEQAGGRPREHLGAQHLGVDVGVLRLHRAEHQGAQHPIIFLVLLAVDHALELLQPARRRSP